MKGGLLTEYNVNDLKNGNADAFEVFVNDYQGKIFSICAGMLPCKEDALDVTQEVFIKIYNNIRNFNEKSSLSTWVYRIAKNACYDFLRKKHYNIESEIPENIADDKNLLPEDILEKVEDVKTVRMLIKEIPVKYRMPLLLREYENLSYDEISKVLQISEGTVKSRIYRAKEYLLKLLSDNMELF